MLNVMKGIKNKKMTLDKLSNTVGKLASTVTEGFQSVRADIKGVQADIEKLAISTANGFDKVDKRLDQHDKIFNLMIKEIKTIHEDNKYFRQSISSLNFNDLSYDRKIENLTIRVEKLELK